MKQMETFESPSSGRTYATETYDAMGNIIDKASPRDGFENDLEAQEIRNEFKRPPY